MKKDRIYEIVSNEIKKIIENDKDLNDTTIRFEVNIEIKGKAYRITIFEQEGNA